ncbi:MAG: FeoB-associated Cys-rich membrane protein [Pseudomonadota bacterium]
MENLIVGFIVGAAVMIFVRNLVKEYKGESGCNCGGNCNAKKAECGMIQNGLDIVDGKR